ncbi:MAG: hypothetical protein PVSMB1_17470 [Gemmatimonadaceae bacterium]
MTAATVIVVVAVGVIVTVLAYYFVHRDTSVPPPVSFPIDEVEDSAERQARIDVLEERGSELLHRRAALDATRGTLGGNTQIFDEFEELEQRLRGGEIDDAEFERRKIELLGG